MPFKPQLIAPLRLSVTAEQWPLRNAFVISRGAKTTAEVVVVRLQQSIPQDAPPQRWQGWGEAAPYARYGETTQEVLEQLQILAPLISGGLNPARIKQIVPSPVARNALDCAWWDLLAKLENKPVWSILGAPAPRPCITAYTISLGTPAAMAQEAARHRDKPLLKLKIGQGALDIPRIEAVRQAHPAARLILDCNEGWKPIEVAEKMAILEKIGNIALLEQPVPAGQEAVLASIQSTIPICADETVHGLETLGYVSRYYQAVNIKLDKTGGLTEAYAMVQAARRRGLKVMLGCMVATSLAIAPLVHLSALADFIDLDAPLLLARDRPNGLASAGALLFPDTCRLWGHPSKV